MIRCALGRLPLAPQLKSKGKILACKVSLRSLFPLLGLRLTRKMIGSGGSLSK